MDRREIRTRVAEALSGAGVAVGTYTLPNGSEVPALSVGDPPEGTLADGLEVLIVATPEPEIISTFGGGFALKSWIVRVINHGDSDLDGALDALSEAFGPIPTPQLIPEAGDIAEQAVLRLPDD